MRYEVETLELFHVSQAVPYNPHPTPQVGQVLQIGAQGPNPYYAFFEQQPVYTVRMAEGEISLGPVLWLENVRQGKVTPDNLPVAAHEIAKHFQTLARELVMEMVRRDVQPGAPSRQSCLWASEDRNLMDQWRSRLGGASQAMRLRATGVVHRADAALLMAGAEPISTTMRNATRYWLGEHSDAPELEVLFVGQAEVLELL